MASTRFSNDDARIKKALQQATDPGRWIMNVPGTGSTPVYMEDPHIRMQAGGGCGLRTNALSIEDDLRGATRRLNRDHLGKDVYTAYTPSSHAVSCKTNTDLTTEQSRAIAPAWTIRGTDTLRWQPLHVNPQLNSDIYIPFKTNVSTRIVEKDSFTPTRNCM